MAQPEPDQPATEARGGERPDWDAARPGQPLPERPRPEPEPPDAA